ncbi:septum formation initiator family protein [Alsobacter sp. SYSU M60028]|uniref:Septum formation initiator family protein n=1 Tax=Alsobacter ponti TaxID=2962936 RepID=A0ABT1LAP5_9HYPH|nr:septum formation initiator family protein [Alsobacter ponti]MCP8938186.1 septum formation initiator family protein [Alsobacter ponti]
MVVRARYRRFLLPLLLYVVAGAVVGYFVYHAQHGDRGIETKAALKRRIVELNGDLAELKEQRADWERRVAMLRADNVDRDLLEERARISLNRLHRNEVVIITGTSDAPSRK